MQSLLVSILNGFSEEVVRKFRLYDDKLLCSSTVEPTSFGSIKRYTCRVFHHDITGENIELFSYSIGLPDDDMKERNFVSYSIKQFIENTL